MNAEKYQQLIIRRTVKAANKKNRRTPDNLDLETLRDLKVANVYLQEYLAKGFTMDD